MTARKPPEEHKQSGQPTKYKPEYCELAKNYAIMGATDEQIAVFLKVSVATIGNWKNKHPKFLEALKEGKAIADHEVIKSLRQRAIGYEHKEDKIFQYEGQPVRVPTIKHYPPDPMAAKLWLYNRDPENWKDKREIDHTLKTPIIHFDKSDLEVL